MKKKVLILSSLVIVLALIVFIQPSYSVIEESDLIKDEAKLYIDNISEVIEVNGAKELSKPLVINNKITNISAELHNPGDYIAYSFDIVNPTNNEVKIKDVIKNMNFNDELLGSNVSIDLIYTHNSLYEVSVDDVIFPNNKLNVTMDIIYNNGPGVVENIDLLVDNIYVEIDY